MSHSGQAGIFFDSGGERLLGTLFLAPGETPKPTALLLHGIPGIEKNYDLAHCLRENGWNSLIFHYRGCWGSAGAYCLQTIPDDVRAAVDALTLGDYPWVDAQRIVVVGHSLGGWAAVLAAAGDPRIRAVAAIAAVTDPRAFPLASPEIAAEYTPWLSGVTAEDLAGQWAALDELHTPLQQVSLLRPRPLLIVHSAADDVVPVDHSRRLSTQAAGFCTYLEHAEANHSFTWHRRWLQQQLLDWLDHTALQNA